MRFFVLPVVLVLTLAMLSSAQEAHDCEKAYKPHWAHCIAVPATKDISSITTLTVAVDNFCSLPDHQNEVHAPITLHELSRGKQGRFSTKDWVSHNPIHDAWFQLDAKGKPTYHVIPTEGTDEEVYTLRRIGSPADTSTKRHVWIIQRHFPYCTQPRFEPMYQDLSWWQVFEQRDKWMYGIKITSPYRIVRVDLVELKKKYEMRKKLNEAKKMVREVEEQNKEK